MIEFLKGLIEGVKEGFYSGRSKARSGMSLSDTIRSVIDEQKTKE